MASTHLWQPEFYDRKLSFVSQYGKEVIELLQPLQGERILDLGCGTGDLTNEISKSGAYVTGMDLSSEMVAQASRKYPEIDFVVGNAESFSLDHPVAAVFSNAALHWVKNAEEVISSVWKALEPGGRFVAELGGKGNIDKIVKAISAVMAEEYGMDADKLNPWYFPSLGEYTSLLERQGFRVIYAVHFDRPTLLADGEKGLVHWLRGFAADEFFKGFDESAKMDALDKISQRVSKDLFENGSWYADYKRLRIAAVKIT